VFLVAALWRMPREGFKLAPARRTRLMVAVIFGLISGWLWWSGVGAKVGALCLRLQREARG
jgi:hypothetical protein